MAGLPMAAAQPVKRRRPAAVAKAAEHFNILDRQIQFVAVFVDQAQTIVERTGDLDRLQAVEATDPVVDVHHEIALGQGRRLAQEVTGPPGRSGFLQEPVPQEIAFGEKGQTVGLETAFQWQHHKPQTSAGQGFCRLPIGGDLGGYAMIAKHGFEALAGPHAVGRHEHSFSLFFQAFCVAFEDFVDVFLARLTFGREVTAKLGRHGDQPLRGRLVKRAQLAHRGLGQVAVDLVPAQIKGGARQRLVDRAETGLERPGLAPRLIIIFNHVEAGRDCFGELIVEDHQGSVQVIEQRLHVLVKQGQPVLDARMATTLADRFVEGVRFGDGAEMLVIAFSKAANRSCVKNKFVSRQKMKFVALAG